MKSTQSLSHEATTKKAQHVCGRDSRGARADRRPSSPTGSIPTTNEVVIRLSRFLTHPYHVRATHGPLDQGATGPRRP
jgi:hypothetical protein